MTSRWTYDELQYVYRRRTAAWWVVLWGFAAEQLPKRHPAVKPNRRRTHRRRG